MLTCFNRITCHLPPDERAERLRRIARISMDVRDEFGVPFALYSAHTLARERIDRELAQEIARKGQAELLQSRFLSPSACYLIRDLLTGARRAIESRCKELDMAQRLAADYPLLPVVASARASPPTWSYWQAGDWFLSTSTLGNSRVLVAIRKADVQGSLGAGGAQLVMTGARAEPLGDGFINAFVTLPDAVGAGGGGASQLFYLVALAAVLIFAATSARLMLKDIKRDVATSTLRAQFVSGVTHELKTPLAAIRMYAETMHDRPTIPDRTRREYLATIVAESERLTRLLDNVLDFSRIERGATTYKMRPLCLGVVVADAAAVMGHAFAQQGFTLRLDISDSDPRIMGNADALKQALLNLLTNAMKYSGESRHIELALHTTNGVATVDVTDRGIGIAESEHAKVFEQFYRVPTPEHSGATGEGLGLTIVRNVADAHGGRISLRSTPGAGSVFALHFPAIDESSVSSAERSLASDSELQNGTVTR